MATRPTSKLTVAEVLFDNSACFKQFMATNLKKVVSVMIEKKVVNKTLARYCMNTDDSELLLANMKEKMNLDNFLGYLEILTEFGSQEDYDGETRTLMRLMKGSLEAMRPEPDSRHDAVMKQFIAVALPDQTLSPTDQSQHLVTGAPTETLVKESVSSP